MVLGAAAAAGALLDVDGALEDESLLLAAGVLLDDSEDVLSDLVAGASLAAFELVLLL